MELPVLRREYLRFGIFHCPFQRGAFRTVSSLRTFVCVSGCILFLPKYLDLLGVWLAIPVAEVLTIVVAIILFVGARKKISIRIKKGCLQKKTDLSKI